MYCSWIKLPGFSDRKLERFLFRKPSSIAFILWEFLLTMRQGSGTIELNGGWKIFHSSVNAAMFAQASFCLLVSPNIAEYVFDWVPLGGLSSKAKAAEAISVCLAGVCTRHGITVRNLSGGN